VPQAGYDGACYGGEAGGGATGGEAGGGGERQQQDPGLDNTKYGRIFNIILIRIIRNTWSSQV